MRDWSCDYRRLRAELIKSLSDQGYRERDYNADAMLSKAQVRNAKIRKEYNELHAPGEKSKELYHALARKYSLTYNYIWKVINLKL